ncbi:hypothetical protein J2W40_002190 [Sphingobium xenophagum]|uniref:Uncharacterized protein n=1 Tax=Sphingobium xenophagum TaxID=121428 RepID=A0ABU1X193_SPHXE|nr:hypothetical protein [Sphingobium xenophagum]MDR7155363.1 hypothetical protein [Sphingobium xenophagum]
MAEIIMFPPDKVVRSPGYIDAIEKLALLDDYDLSGDPIKVAIAGPMRQFWTERLRELGGVQRRCDGLGEGVSC